MTERALQRARRSRARSSGGTRTTRRLAEVFEDVDIILTPTTATTAFGREGPMPTEIDGTRDQADARDHVHVSVQRVRASRRSASRAASMREGLPVGLQIVGRRHDDHVALQLARAFEKASRGRRSHRVRRVSEPPTERSSSRTDSSGARRRRAPGAKAGTGTTTGGRGSTTPGRRASIVSGDAIDHYHRFEDDFALLGSLRTQREPLLDRVGAHRARARRVLERGARPLRARDRRVRKHGMTPFVTLHHFSSPRWLARGRRLGEPGDRRPLPPLRRRRRARLGDRIPIVCTINEPQIVAFIGYQGRASRPAPATRSCSGR